jgi:threonine dehydratase
VGGTDRKIQVRGVTVTFIAVSRADAQPGCRIPCPFSRPRLQARTGHSGKRAFTAGFGRSPRLTLMGSPLTLEPPAFHDMLAARRVIRRHLEPTPLRAYPNLSRLVGAEVWVKHENFQPTGAFKVRGGINLISRLSQEERERGVIAASTGNHGQSIAYAARLFDVEAIICAPARANPVKVEGMRDLGAEVVLEGPTYDEARTHCEELAARHGYRYVHSGNEPLLIAGVGTIALEMLEEQQLDVLVVPVGGGSGASAACIVANAIDPRIEVIGVQSRQSPAAYESWRQGELVEAPNRTVAEGLSTGTAFELPQRILRERLDDLVMVDDSQILAAVRTMVEKTRTMVEPAGAAPLAAALQLRTRLAGKRVGLVCSGGNISPDQLGQVLGGAG